MTWVFQTQAGRRSRRDKSAPDRWLLYSEADVPCPCCGRLRSRHLNRVLPCTTCQYAHMEADDHSAGYDSRARSLPGLAEVGIWRLTQLALPIVTGFARRATTPAHAGSIQRPRSAWCVRAIGLAGGAFDA